MADALKKDGGALIEFARSTIAHYLDPSQPKPARPVLGSVAPPLGAFVTLYKDGRLRGCIGHLEPIHDDTVAEIEDCAVLAATRDPRFPPLRLSELAQTVIEISLIHPSQKVNSIEELDPSRYGVIIRAGPRVGTLLPDIEGVETSAMQVQIAAEKAGIGLEEEYELSRYQVEKIKKA